MFQHLSYFLCFFLIAFFVQNSRAQDIGPATVNAAGNTYTQNDIIYEWSIGEIALVETMISSKGSITNGLLQPVLSGQITTERLFIVPANILTANGDGKNDTWVIKDLDKYPDNEVTVFDRAGRIVFIAKNYQNDWTGTLSGHPLAEDAYYYIIKIKKAGKEDLTKGFITILN